MLDECGCGTWGESTGCTVEVLNIPGSGETRRLPFHPKDEEDRCPFCSVGGGRLHHLGCAAEHCPECREPLAECQHGELLSELEREGTLASQN